MLENEAGDFEKFWSASKFGKASIGRFWISPIEDLAILEKAL